MANPGDLPSVMVLADRVDSLVTTIGEAMARLEAVEERVAVFEAIRRIDTVLVDSQIALIRDGMSQTALGGGE